MKALVTFFLSSLLIVSVNIFAQERCLPNGIIVESQSQIDSFPINYPQCTKILGPIWISDTSSDVSNLFGFSQIDSLGGPLGILENDLITDFTGLNNLFYADGLIVNCCSSLTSLAGLEKLEVIVGIGSESSFVYNNPLLTDISALQNLTTINSDFVIAQNNILTRADNFENVALLSGSLEINDNPALRSISGFNNIDTVFGDIRIVNNPVLDSFSCFAKIQVVDYLKISETPLSYINGFSSLKKTKGLHIDNSNFTNLDIFDSLTLIDGSIWIAENQLLTDISGIANILPDSIIDFYLFLNPLLSDCHISSICEFLEINYSKAYLYNNAVGCITPEEVHDQCTNDVSDIMENRVVIHYSLGSQSVEIITDNKSLIEKVTVYTDLS